MAQRHAPPLASGEQAHRHIVGREHQGIGGDVHQSVDFPAPNGVDLFLQPAHLLHELVEIVSVLRFGHAGRDGVEPVDEVLQRFHRRAKILPHGLIERQFRLLGHIADAHSLGQRRGAVELGFDPGHDPQQSRLAGPVFTNDADFCPIKKRQADIAQHHLVAVRLADVVHLENELRRHRNQLD